MSTISLGRSQRFVTMEREKKKSARLFSFRGTMKYRVGERIKRRNPSVIFPLTARGEGDRCSRFFGWKTRTGVNTGSRRDLSNARKYALYVSLATLCAVSVGSRRFPRQNRASSCVYLFTTSISNFSKMMFDKRSIRSNFYSIPRTV